MLIAAIGGAEEKYGPGDRRPVLIHGQFLREDQVDAIKRAGHLPVALPDAHLLLGRLAPRPHGRPGACGQHLAHRLGACARGMMFSSHHDAPVAFPDSMRVLDATVTRRSRSGDIIGPDQRVDVITALKAMTIWPAYQYFEEDQKGSIEVGKLADLVILSDDPTAIDPETLDQLKVAETIKEGATDLRREREGGPARLSSAARRARPLRRLPAPARDLPRHRGRVGQGHVGLASRLGAPTRGSCVAATVTAMLTEGLETAAN